MSYEKEREEYFNQLAEEAEEFEKMQYSDFLCNVMENFDIFWQTELSSKRPDGNEDTEEFVRRIAEMAYLKGVEDYK